MKPSPASAGSGLPSAFEQLSQTLAVEPAGFGELLLLHCAKSHLPLSVKEIASGRYVWLNAPMAALLGVPSEHALGKLDAELPLAEVLAPLRAAEQSASVQPAGVVSEHRFDLAGRRRDYSVLRLPLVARDAAGTPPRYLAALWTDMTETRQREAQLRSALEQLEEQQRIAEQLRREASEAVQRGAGEFGRGHFDELLRREIDLSSREHREFALVLVALDPAPEGAPAANPSARSRVLDALGQQLRSKTRAMDSSCRLGEDCYAVLLSGVGLATAHSRMEGMRRQCAQHIVVLDGQDFGFTVSMGVASFPHTADSQEPLVDAAKTALLESKRRGGNHVSLASIPFEHR